MTSSHITMGEKLKSSPCCVDNVLGIRTLSRRWLLACAFTSLLFVWMLFHQNKHDATAKIDSPAVVTFKSSSTALGLQPTNATDNNIVFLTFVDRVIPGLCLGMETAAMNGIALGALGVGMSGKFQVLRNVTNKKTRKLFAYQLALTDAELRAEYGITNDTIVSFCDGTDVLYMKTADHVKEQYEALEQAAASPGLILVGAERNCWPYVLDSEELVPGGREYCKQFPDLNSTSRYLNSGSILGRASHLMSMLSDVIEAMQSVDQDDQLCLQEAYLKQIQSDGRPSGYYFGLDARQEIFQVAWATHLSSGNNYSLYEDTGAYYNESIGQIVNTEHNVSPASVHLNGKKAALVPIAKHYLQFHASDPSRKFAYDGIRQDYIAHYEWFREECIPKLEALQLNGSSTTARHRRVSLYHVALSLPVLLVLFLLREKLNMLFHRASGARSASRDTPVQ